VQLEPISRADLLIALARTKARDSVIQRVAGRLFTLENIRVGHDKDTTVLVAGDVVAVAKRNVRDAEDVNIGLAVAANRL